MKNQIYLLSGLLFIASCKISKSESKEDAGKKLSTIDKASMSSNVDPRKDFFLFSNENWIINNPIPPSESRWGSFNELEQSNKKKLTLLLEECTQSLAKKGADDHILGSYYASFINMEKRNSNPQMELKHYLVRIEKLSTTLSIPELLAEQHILGVRSLFGFGVRQDIKNVNYHISYLSQGGIGLPNRDYYLNENKKEVLAQYEKHVTRMLMLFGKDPEQAGKMAESILRIEHQIAESMLSPAEMRVPEKTYNKFSKTDAKALMPNFNLDDYLKRVYSSEFDTVIVANPEHLKTVNTLLDRKNLQDLKAYMYWRVVNHFSSHLTEKHVAEHFEFYGKILSGKSEIKPLNERAIDEITGSNFGQLLGKKFVDKHYSEEAQRRVNEMVDNLLLVFRDRINGLDWMSEETKKEAVNKLNCIGRKLGFPENWKDFSYLGLDPENYLYNYMEIQRQEHFKNMEKLNQAVDKSEWGMPAHMVNAYYHPLLNEIAFPAGIMQPPFFDVNAEDAINYGRIGMVIGHEFTHGFDDMGSKFAADGTFKNWWTENDRKLFEDKTGVLGETFAAFCPIEGHCINPHLTMGENIADLGGLTMAHYAYARTEEFKKNEKREGFTPAQRFFIAYAQLWKISYTDEELKNRIATDSHSPGMYRVNGPLMNCPEFFEAFGIKEGDPMRNPKEKVARIW